MTSIEYTHEDDDAGKTWDICVGFNSVRYSPASYFEPAEGGYAEIEDIEVQSVTTTDENGTATTVYRWDLNEEQKKALDEEFNKLYNASQSLQDHIQERCDEWGNDRYDHHERD